MSEAYARSYFWCGMDAGPAMNWLGMKADLNNQSVTYPPGGHDEMQALGSTMWRWLYPYEVVNSCRR